MTATSIIQRSQSNARYGGYRRRASAAMEPIRRALNYRPHVEIVPDKSNVALGGKSSYEHRVSVPPGAALIGLAGVSQQPEGFTVQIIDAGTGAALCSSAPQLGNITAQGNPNPKDVLGNVNTAALDNQVFYLPKYRLVTEPGLLRVQILNLSAQVNSVQLALRFVLPPRPGDPVNHFNALMEEELNTARRAARGPSDNATPGVMQTQAVITGGDAMSQPATNVPFTVLAASVPCVQSVVKGAAGFRVAIHQLYFYSAAAQNVRLIDSRGNELHPVLPDYKGGFSLPYQHEEPHFVLPPGLDFQFDVSAGSTGDTGSITGFAKVRMLEKWGGQ